jgi:excisionase family DNA binding protein
VPFRPARRLLMHPQHHNLRRNGRNISSRGHSTCINPHEQLTRKTKEGGGPFPGRCMQSCPSSSSAPENLRRNGLNISSRGHSTCINQHEQLTRKTKEGDGPFPGRCVQSCTSSSSAPENLRRNGLNISSRGHSTCINQHEQLTRKTKEGGGPFPGRCVQSCTSSSSAPENLRRNGLNISSRGHSTCINQHEQLRRKTKEGGRPFPGRCMQSCPTSSEVPRSGENIVKLATRCVAHFRRNQMRTGVTLECAVGIFIASLNSLNDSTCINRVGIARAARLVGVSRFELQAMAEAGEIPSMRVGGTYCFFEIDLVIWIMAQRVTGLEAVSATSTDPGRSRRSQRTP